MNSWLLLNSGKGSAALNMALYEALLETVSQIGKPVLRFYVWTEPAATFGYFQKHADVERATLLRPLVRRPTGGGIVPHDADWTYSLVFPPGHEWHSLKAEESYRRVHDWLRLAFAAFNFETELAPSAKKNAVRNPQVQVRAFPVMRNLTCSGMEKKSPAQRNGGTSSAFSFKARSSRRRVRRRGRIGRKRCARWRQRVFR